MDIYYSLIQVLSELSVLRQKLLNYHWNVTGPDFYSYHLLFERIYESVDPYIDRVAELSRTYGKAPGSFTTYLALSSIKETPGIPAIPQMVTTLIKDFETLQNTVIQCCDDADDVDSTSAENLMGELAETLSNGLYLLRSSIE